jgi:sortase A
MRVVINCSVRRFLSGAQRALFAVSFLLLGYCVYALSDSFAFQRRASREFDLRVQSARAPNDTTKPARNTSQERPASIAPNGLIGRLDVPRVGLSAFIFEGTGQSTLSHAVGHIPSTILPGQSGNVGLAAHRDTFFRPLKDVRLNDIVTLTTLGIQYRYRVVSTRVVAPTEISVLRNDNNNDEVLTLVTCYPFYFLGSAPDRFIVRAKRIT